MKKRYSAIDILNGKPQQDEKEHIEKIEKPRAIKNFRKILADKNVKSVEQKGGWTYIQFKNGQIFGCRGPVVDAVLSGMN